MTHSQEQIEAAKAEAMQVHFDSGIPVRVFERDGQIIWSKVDDNMRDLTPKNSEGLLFHVRNVFVPHGAPNPLEPLRPSPDTQEAVALADELEATARRYGDTMGLTRDGAIRRIGKMHDALLDAVTALRSTPDAGTEMLREAAKAYVAERDEDAWCQRVKYGICRLRKCNVEGGWEPGNPCDHSLATCARYRLEQALAKIDASPLTGDEK